MKEATINAIEAIAKSDPSVTPAIIRALKKACTPQEIKPGNLINARRAMEILDITRPTLRRLTRSGKLHEVKPTPRKTRFFLDEVEALAYGVEK